MGDERSIELERSLELGHHAPILVVGGTPGGIYNLVKRAASRNGAIDWSELWRVINGDGPCNRERLETRRRAHANGAWVREAALAFARKRKAAARAA